MPFRKKGVGGSASGNSFETIQTPAGTSPVAESSTDTLTLTSTGGTVTITGDSSTDTINFEVATTPPTATYIVVSLDATLTNERRLQVNTTNLSLTDGGANGDITINTVQNIATSSTPTFAGLTLSGLTEGSILFSGSGGVISQDNANLFFDNTTNTLIVGDPGSEASGINLNGTTYNSVLKVSDLGVGREAEIILHRHSTTVTPAIVTSRSNSDTSSHASVTAGMDLFFISASGWTGSHYDTFAFISFSVDAGGTVSSTSSPGRIDLRVAPDGSDAPAIALSVRQNKVIEMPGYGAGYAKFNSSGVISSDTIDSTDISDFNEAVDDRVDALIQDGTGLAWTYNDGANTLTGNVSLSAFSTTNLSEGTNLYYTDERVDDRVAVLIQNGTGISWSYNDGAGTLTPTISLSSFSTTNLSEGTNLYFTDERAQDAIGTILVDSSTIDFTYSDGTPSITASVIANSSTQKVEVTKNSGAVVGTRKQLNFIEGTNVTLTISDDAGNDQVDITIAATGSSGAPSDATYVTLSTNGTLTNERVLTGTSNQITVTDNGAGSTVVLSTPQNIHTGASPTFTGLTLSGLTSTGVLYNQSGVITTESVFTYDQSTNVLYVPEVAGGSTGSASFMLSANTATFADTNTGRIQFMERMTWDQSWTAAGSAGVLSDALLKFIGTLTTGLSINILPSIQDTRTVRYSTSQTVSAFATFVAGTIYQPTAAVTDGATYTQFAGFVSRPQYAPDISSGTATTDALIGFSAAPTTRRINAGTSAITSITGFGTYVTPLILANDLENVTVTNFYHFRASNPFTSGLTLTNNIAHYTPALSVGTNRYGYYSDLTANANYWDIYSAGGAQSSHEGLFKFGDNVAPTALVHTTGSTTARASVRIEAGTAPTTPNSGDLWHDSTRQCFQVYCGGTTLGLQKVLFVATAAATVGGTGTETTVAGTGIGSLTLPANFLTIGKTIKIRAWGVYGTKAPAVGTFDLRFKYGSTTLITLSPTLTGSLTNQHWQVEAEFTCRTTGATGTVFAQAEADFYTSTTAVGVIVAAPTATVTIDTTASSKVDITADWGTSNASNTITCHNFTAEVLY